MARDNSPAGTKSKQMTVNIQPGRLRLSLDWCGRVVDGPLHRRVKASEALWALAGGTVQVQATSVSLRQIVNKSLLLTCNGRFVL